MGGVMDRWLGGWMGASMGKKGGLWEMNEIDIFLLVVVFSFSFFSFRQSFWILVFSGVKQKHANLCFATCLLFFFVVVVCLLLILILEGRGRTTRDIILIVACGVIFVW